MPIEPHPTDPELVVMRSHKYNLQKPWVGLTDEEIESAISDGFARGLDDGNVSNREVIHYVRAIEAALRSKNT